MPSDSERSSHWDFMLESEGELLTWQWDVLPDKALSFRTEQLPNHRIAYLTLEGTLSGNRGMVYRIDEGTFEPALLNSCTEFEIALQTQRFSGTLAGKRIQVNQWVFSYSPID